ncbi:MAG: nucleoside phosphorylase [Anaerolineae bacterium]
MLPILKVRPADVATLALVVGDPARAEQTAKLLDEVKQVGANREYVTFTGHLGGERITICSHGVGSAGAGVCFEELARAGARTLIRAGTCGALRDNIADGELVISTGAVREEGLTPRLVPLSYPALAHYEVIEALQRAAAQAGERTHIGVTLTSDLFYPSAALGQEWGVWQHSRVVAIEMELSALLIVAALHSLRAGGIFTVDGNPTHSAQDMSDYNPHRPVVAEGKAKMLKIALAALRDLSQI